MDKHKHTFSSSRLSYFENACTHYGELLDEGVKLLKAAVGEQTVELCEIGPGIGGLTSRLLKELRVNKLFAVDCDEKLLQTCESKISLSVDQLSCFTQSDGQSFLEAHPNRFDVIATSYVIHNLETIEKLGLINAISGALKKNGKLLLIDKIAETDQIDASSLGSQIQQFLDFYKSNPNLQKEMIFWIGHYINDEQPMYRYTEAALETMLKNAGILMEAKTNRKLLDRAILCVKA